MNDFDRFVKSIGCLVIALVLYLFPIFGTLSFVLNWSQVSKFVFLIFNLAILLILTLLLYLETESY